LAERVKAAFGGLSVVGAAVVGAVFGPFGGLEAWLGLGGGAALIALAVGFADRLMNEDDAKEREIK